MSEPTEDAPLLPSMPGGQPYDHRGVDVTLIDYTMSLTPRERLELLRSAVASIEMMRRAASRVRPADSTGDASDTQAR